MRFSATLESVIYAFHDQRYWRHLRRRADQLAIAKSLPDRLELHENLKDVFRMSLITIDMVGFFSLDRHKLREILDNPYQCRPAGKPASYDVRFQGTYNARRDSLGGFWKDLFGYSHGVAIVSAFFENVSQHSMEHRELAAGEQEKNVILEFRPEPAQDMLVACLWSKWEASGQPSLMSFAAITDDPPSEVAAAGHDRFIIPIKPENIDAWLKPDPENLAAQYAILADRDRPYYEHRIAA